MKILLKNGLLTDPKNKIIGQKLDVLINNGRVVKIGQIKPDKSTEVIEVKGKIVAPGFIDMHVHLREPGREDKETIATGTRAAARGGFTTVVAMPNTNPSADSPVVLEYIISRAAKEGVVNVYSAANITQGARGEQLAEIGQLKKYGAIALTDDGLPLTDMYVYRRALEYASMFNLPILSHSQDMALTNNGVIHEGSVSTELGLPGQPAAAEALAVAREIVLAEMTDQPIHFCHLSSAQAVELIRGAKERGLKVTAETAPHYFTLTDEDVKKYGSNAIMQPPLRPKNDVKAIIEYLKNDTIDVIATDHAPHLLSDKYQELEEVARGIVGLETSIPLVMTHLVNKKKLSIKQMVEKMSVNPARILGLDKGHLSIGAAADITVIDPHKQETIDKEKFVTKGRNTPFHGWKVKGVPAVTMVGGRVVMKDQKII